MTSSDETAFDDSVLETLRSRVGESLEPSSEGRGLRVALVCARFNGGITTRLLAGALDALEQTGVDRRDISLTWVPGAFEIPLAALAYADADRPYDAVITLGAVIRGDTGHYELVAGECARGVQDVQLSTRVPIIFGVLTTNTVEQALERSRPDETNKGRECVLSALAMVSVLRQGTLAPS
ncbi:MAG: 6,7-dimethyl-8-ribityllumazine synthase [Acidimicrobiaceae bacterium]|nr:6,7-dimethyl-8-ribityllumazine synthase [Acidimicrobiaceae bacterium]